MRAASQAPAVLDGPSTSGRCLCTPTVVYTSRRGRLCIAKSSHMPIGLYNTQPIPGYRPPAAEGVVKGSRTTATPRLTPGRVRADCQDCSDHCCPLDNAGCCSFLVPSCAPGVQERIRSPALSYLQLPATARSPLLPADSSHCCCSVSHCCRSSSCCQKTLPTPPRPTSVPSSAVNWVGLSRSLDSWLSA